MNQPGIGGRGGFEEFVLCPHCGSENLAAAFACRSCDHVLAAADLVSCSKCGFENTTELLECLNCGHTLADTEAQPDDTGKTVEVFSTWNPALAEAVRQKLESSGFDCEVWNSGVISSIGDYSLGLGGGEKRVAPLVILVPAGQVSGAKALLEQIIPDTTEPESADQTLLGAAMNPQPATEPLRCPACQTPYRLEDYDPQALHIYCSSCRTELTRTSQPPRSGW